MQGRGFRADIEGLRAISVLAVVIYHAFPTLLPGGFVGVDVFFVISGYLITRLLVTEWTARGRIDLAAFWARRIRRILPIASLVLVVTIGLILVTPALDARALAPHAIAAALFVHNFHQARAATDYLGASHAENPLLHYWSLSVEEQFYLVWPLLLVGLFALGRRWNRPSLALIGAGVVVAASFGFNLALTTHDPAFAFFHPLARAWQLGLGATLALAEPSIAPRLSAAGGRIAATALAGLGVLGLGAGLVLISNAVVYPGAVALVPTVAAAALIAAHGLASTPIGRLLSAAPLRLIGRLSFGWYLWHWPALVFGRLILGSSVAVDLMMIGLSFALAFASFHLVETPIRHGTWFQRPRWRAYGLGVGLVGATVGIGVALRAFGPDAVPVGDGILLSATAIKADRPVLYEDGCLLRFAETDQPPCRYGDLAGHRVVVLMGDSHAGNWFPALEAAARQQGWGLIARVKATCAPLDAPAQVTEAGRRRAYPECEAWRLATLDEIERLRPALIILASTRHTKPIEAERAVFGRLARVAPVVIMRGTPWLKEDALTCLRRTRDPDACQWPLADLLVRHNFPRTPVAQLPANTRILDLNDRLCPNGVCRAARDGRVLMFDQHHLTASASMELMPVFRELLQSLP